MSTSTSEISGTILITGGTGQVGSELVRSLGSRSCIKAPARVDLDLHSPDSMRAVVRALRPRWIINAAAFTAVDRAETDAAEAFAINAHALGVLGEEARKIDAVILHLSTDYVFPGTGSRPYTEADPTGPLNVYGASKLAGEHALIASGAAHLIFRTSWVYSTTGHNFLLTILRLAREREQLKIVDDQHGAPTSARDLARMITHVVDQCEHQANADRHALARNTRPIQGIYHATAQGETTWFAFAQEALRLRALAEPATHLAELLPIPSAEYPTPARRPLNSRLDCSKLNLLLHYRMPLWQQSLSETVAELSSDPPKIPSSLQAVSR